MTGTTYKIGELARVAGVTVRALHHYDALGLLVPSERTAGGHRLYTAADVRRLYRLLALRRLGLPLNEIGSHHEPDLPLLDALEAMSMIENYYTPEQLAQLEERRRQLGENAIRAVEREWPELLAKVREHREQGTDPSDPAVQALAARADELTAMFHGGDPGIKASLQRMYEQEGPKAASRGMVDPQDMAYLQEARTR